jgi:hypothetical protein
MAREGTRAWQTKTASLLRVRRSRGSTCVGLHQRTLCCRPATWKRFVCACIPTRQPPGVNTHARLHASPANYRPSLRHTHTILNTVRSARCLQVYTVGECWRRHGCVNVCVCVCVSSPPSPPLPYALNNHLLIIPCPQTPQQHTYATATTSPQPHNHPHTTSCTHNLPYTMPHKRFSNTPAQPLQQHRRSCPIAAANTSTTRHHTPPRTTPHLGHTMPGKEG